MGKTRPRRILLTDHPWPEIDIEREFCDQAGFELVEAPADATSSDLAALSADVEGILTCWANVSKEVIEAATHLRAIARLGVGVDNIDLAVALRRGIVVTRVPDYCVEEVSDHVVALILGWARGIVPLDRSVRENDPHLRAKRLRRVRRLTIGIWGAGANGLCTAEKLSALGCSVLVDNRHGGGRFEAVPVGRLLGESDVVSLHLPLTNETRGIVGRDALSRMRPGALLVNTGRGGLVDEEALVEALNSGHLSGAALDVLSSNFDKSSALVGRDDVVLTPHVAFSSDESVVELRQRASEDLIGVLQGREARHPVTAAL